LLYTRKQSFGNEEKNLEQETPSANTCTCENAPEETLPHPEQHKEEESEEEEATEDISGFSVSEILHKLEEIVNKRRWRTGKKIQPSETGSSTSDFGRNRRKEKRISCRGNSEENFHWEHPLLAKLSGLTNIFKEKLENFHKKLEEEQQAKQGKKT
jgi:hypothetical protein